MSAWSLDRFGRSHAFAPHRRLSGGHISSGMRYAHILAALGALQCIDAARSMQPRLTRRGARAAAPTRTVSLEAPGQSLGGDASLRRNRCGAAWLDASTRRTFGGAAALALARPATAAAAPAAPPADAEALIDAALRAKPDELRPIASNACAAAATPSWLVGEWTVAAARFDNFAFPRSGFGAAPPTTTAGSRRGTILALPNVGATPRNYRRTFEDALGPPVAADVTATLKAFWPEVDDVAVCVVTKLHGAFKVQFLCAHGACSRTSQRNFGEFRGYPDPVVGYRTGRRGDGRGPDERRRAAWTSIAGGAAAAALRRRRGRIFGGAAT